ncbi:Na+/H+ antiporter Mnh1 subunit G [Staphylococcus epidermidis]
MIATIVTSVSIIFVVLGALISAFAATGLIRLRDVYSRAHAAGKAATLGAMFLLFGAFLYFIGTEGYVNMQLIIGIIFVFITGPLSSHLIMKGAYNIKTPYTKDTKIDEIKEDMKHTKL